MAGSRIRNGFLEAQGLRVGTRFSKAVHTRVVQETSDPKSYLKSRRPQKKGVGYEPLGTLQDQLKNFKRKSEPVSEVEIMQALGHCMPISRKLVHGWDKIKFFIFYSLLALSTHKNAKCYPTMTKVERVAFQSQGKGVPQAPPGCSEPPCRNC